MVQTFQPLLSSFEILAKQLLTAKLVVAASSPLPTAPTHGYLAGGASQRLPPVRGHKL